MNKRIYLTLTFFTFLLFGCSQRTSIKSIQDNPRKYINKEVTVEGTVSKTFSLGFLDYFEIDDGTGKINVITNNPLPKENKTIIVNGVLRDYTLLSVKILVIKENNLND